MSTTSVTNPGPREPVCTVHGLRIGLVGSGADVVDDLDLELIPGQITGLVGESGSGKTTAGTALLGYARAGAAITGGEILVAGHDIRSLTPAQVREVRGGIVGYIPQDPSSALNPALRIGAQLREPLDLHDIGAEAERDARIREIMPEVGLPNDPEFLARFPHQLSGGQVQRVAIAMAFLPRPRVLVLDEPTTGLDVTTQSRVLQTLDELCAEFDVAALYVTHDLAVVATIADRIAVLYAGRLIEEGPTAAVFAGPAHPYTRALLQAIPHLDRPHHLTGIPGRTPGPGHRASGCSFRDRCPDAIEACAQQQPPPVDVGAGHSARCLRVAELPAWDPAGRVVPDTDPGQDREVVLRVEHLAVSYAGRQVVFEVGFDLARQEVLALVGESGSGKTTISRSIGGLHHHWSGTVELDGEQLARSARRRTASQRKRIQYVFQNPYASLNPRRTVEQILLRPLEIFGVASGRAAQERAVQLLNDVQLGENVLKLRANRLSGGERQRVAIARALAAEPEVLVCDEITSALDVSIQGAITELLTRIKNERGIALLFVTHNLALTRTMADRILVLRDGHLVESGLTAAVLDHPGQDYTRELVAHTPRLATR